MKTFGALVKIRFTFDHFPGSIDTEFFHEREQFVQYLSDAPT
jgi:hypothetical protein